MTLIGRDDELAVLIGHLAADRLVTVVGPPGVGKTCLARVASISLAECGQDRTRIVDLAGLGPETGAAGVTGTLAVAIGVGIEPGRELEALTWALGDHAALVVLDNCEHVLEGAAEVAEGLLGRCPGLRVLATSRASLGHGSERILHLGPLEVPPDIEVPSGQVPSSVRLFWERARQVDPSFQLTAASYPPVAAICRHLGGLPLAIELAAARMSALTPTELALRIEPAMLASTSRTSAARHRTLDAAIAWSHDLLTRPEKLLFRRLPGFWGGWTLAAAARICSGQGLSPEAVAPALRSLVDKSLVQRNAGPLGDRYTFTPTIQAFANARWNDALHESGELTDRHLRWCVELAVEADGAIEGPGRAAWLHRLDAEYPNLHCAFTAAVMGRKGEMALRLAGALAGYFAARGLAAQGLQWLATAEDIDGGTSPERLRAKARLAFGHLSYQRLDLEAARTAAEESAALAAGCGDLGLQARSMLTLGSCGLLAAREHELAVDLLEHSRLMAGRSGDPWCHVMAIAGLAWAAMAADNLHEARLLLEEAAMAARADEVEAALAEVLPLLGLVALRQGDDSRADDVSREALVCGEELEVPQTTARALAVLGELAWRSGEAGRARRHAERAAELCRRAGLRGDLSDHLCLLGDLALASGDHESARRCYTEAVAAIEQVQGACPTGVLGLGRVAEAEGDHWAAEVLLERALAGARLGREAGLEAEALTDLGAVLQASGRPERAAARYGEALRCARDQGSPFAVARGLRGAAGLVGETGRPREAARLLVAADGLSPTAGTAAGGGRSVGGGVDPSPAGVPMGIDEAVAMALAELDAVCRPQPGWERLTEQERKVAVLAADRLTNTEIADRLFVTKATVKTHLLHAFAKLGISSRRELAKLVPLPREAPPARGCPDGAAGAGGA